MNRNIVKSRREVLVAGLVGAAGAGAAKGQAAESWTPKKQIIPNSGQSTKGALLSGCTSAKGGSDEVALLSRLILRH